MATPRLTLCLIARDEEELLPGCLASVRGVVDEVVVVDTGSHDRTRAIARGAGARVVEHAWDDDFAAARNAALAPVEEGWVLVLDADERLAPGAGVALRAALEADELDFALLPLHDASRLDARPADVLAGRARLAPPVYLERLFRYTPDLAWEGVVHEHVTRWAARHPRQARVEAPIVHYGNVVERVQERGKSERNLRLLEHRCAEDGGNPSAWTYLGQARLECGDRDGALEAAERAWSLASALAAADLVGPASLWATLLVEAGECEEARATVESARVRHGDHANLDYLEGLAHERVAASGGAVEAAAAAERAFRRALALVERTTTSARWQGVTVGLGETRLGTALLLQGRAREALAAFERALAPGGVELEARLGRCEALVGLGRHDEALEQLEPLLRPELADGWILAALAGCRLSGYAAVAPIHELAVTAAERALLIAPHRRRLLDELARAAG